MVEIHYCTGCVCTCTLERGVRLHERLSVFFQWASKLVLCLKTWGLIAFWSRSMKIHAIHTHTRTHHPPDKTPPSLGLGWWVLVIQLSCSLHARSIKVSVTLYEARGLPSNCILPFRGHNQMQLPNHITTLRFNLCSPDAKGWETETHLSELINWLKHRWVNWNSKQQKCS